MPTYADFDTLKPVTTVSYNDTRLTTALPVLNEDLLGLIRWQVDLANGGIRALRFVHNVNAGTAPGAIAANDVVAWKNAAHTQVTVDQTDSVSALNGIAGVGIGAIALGSKGWVLCVGNVTLNLQAAANPAAGASIIGSTTDKKVNTVAADTAPTNQIVGWATAAASGAGGTVATWVNVL